MKTGLVSLAPPLTFGLSLNTIVLQPDSNLDDMFGIIAALGYRF